MKQDRGAAMAGVDLGQEIHDLRLHGDVERSRRLIGDQRRRLVHQTHRDHRALAHAAGELVRETAELLLGGGMWTSLRRRAASARPACGSACDGPAAPVSCRPILSAGLSDDRGPGKRQPAPCRAARIDLRPCASRSSVVALELDRAVDSAGIGVAARPQARSWSCRSPTRRRCRRPRRARRAERHALDDLVRGRSRPSDGRPAGRPRASVADDEPMVATAGSNRRSQSRARRGAQTGGSCSSGAAAAGLRRSSACRSRARVDRSRQPPHRRTPNAIALRTRSQRPARARGRRRSRSSSHPGRQHDAPVVCGACTPRPRKLSAATVRMLVVIATGSRRSKRLDMFGRT